MGLGLLRGLLMGFLSCAFGSVRTYGEEIDRLLAAVNGKVITEGDLVLARSLNAVISPGDAPSADAKSQEIERLIDQELMRQELKNFRLGQEDGTGIPARLQTLRDAYAQKGGMAEVLRRLGLQESELISYLQLESAVQVFVNFRFRPFAAVSDEEIKSYYGERLAAQFRKSGLALPPLEQIAGKIEEILREEKINAMLEQWIREIRRNSRIEYFDAAIDKE